MTNPEGQTESWVEIWVTGDVNIAAASKTGIKLAPGVHATFHIGGKVDIAGGGSSYGLFNESERPSNLVIHAYGGSSGAIQDFIIRKADFWGAISAPWYKVNFDMSGRHAYGSFVAHQFVVDHGAKLHYDEALEALSVGPGRGYQVMSWVEAVR